jgi:hypothetical protein
MADRFRILIRDGYLCPDCDGIVNDPHECVCGNKLGLHSLQAILDRKPAPAQNSMEGKANG